MRTRTRSRSSRPCAATTRALGSFGSVEVVQDTVMPKAEDITYDVIKSEAQTGKHVYEYIVQVPEQPKRHLTTIFMVVSDCIVTFNFQAKQRLQRRRAVARQICVGVVQDG